MSASLLTNLETAIGSVGEPVSQQYRTVDGRESLRTDRARLMQKEPPHG